MGRRAMAQWYRGRRTSKRSLVRSPAALNVLRRCVPIGKALCSHVHSLDPGVSWYPVNNEDLCVWIVPCAKSGSRAVCYPGVEVAYEQTGPVTRG